jgi:lysylphosphatidylglycerol synthetase-like protein (DUF2156 family)
MGNLWLKIWVWTKGILIAAIALYVLLFVYNNSEHATVWWWFNHKYESTSLLLIGISFLAGIVSAVLVRTTLRTFRQVQDLRDRNRSQRMERELADMKSKASMLQTRPVATTETPVDQEPLE